jgi:hypothetical protein
MLEATCLSAADLNIINFRGSVHRPKKTVGNFRYVDGTRRGVK